MSMKRREALLNSGDTQMSKTLSIINQLESPKKRGRKKGSTNAKKREAKVDFPAIMPDMTEDMFLEHQRKLKAQQPQASQEGDFGSFIDNEKKRTVLRQLTEPEAERMASLDEFKFPEKKIKQIATRVLGNDVHINKSMLKVIGGIAKIWVGEIVEEAKIIQVKEEYEAREALGLNKPESKTEEKDITIDDEEKSNKEDSSSKQNSENNTPNKELNKEDDPKNDQKDVQNDTELNKNTVDNNPDKEESKEPKNEERKKDNIEGNKEKPKEFDPIHKQILMETLHSEEPLRPSHLRIARENYERKRLNSKMTLFN